MPTSDISLHLKMPLQRARASVVATTLVCVACQSSGVIGYYEADATIDSESELPSPVQPDAGPDSGDSVAPVDAYVDATPPIDASPAHEASIPVADAALPICPDNPSALFCDGFEDAGIGPWSYAVQLSGTVAPTNTRAYPGGFASLAASTSNSAQDSAARYGRALAPTVTQGDMWYRARYFLPSSTTISNYFSIASISRGSAPHEGLHVLVYPTHVALEDAVHGRITPGSITHPRDTWVCIEAHIFVDPVVGVFEVFVNEMLSARSVTGTDVAGGYELAELGIHYAPPYQGNLVLYVDDVILARTRVGCL